MMHRRFCRRSIFKSAFGGCAGAALPAIALLAMSMPAGAADWKGKEVVKEGVTHVMNPAQPADAPVSLAPKLLWEAGGDDEEYFFGVISGVATDKNGAVYLLDTQLNDIKVFSPAGEYLRSIGREGEGPGEFRRPADLFFTLDGNVAVVQRMPGRIVLLTPGGEAAGTFPVPEPPDGGMQILMNGRFGGDRIVLATQQMRRLDAGMEEAAALIAVDAKGNKTAEYFTMKNTRNFANLVFNEKDVNINTLI
ncbi:MAG: 6-bladed beta-propeller, partial [Chitinivibrionia bacterium]|nr:6-bladed beta-propeller [Chitinivibrionia bacterium]